MAATLARHADTLPLWRWLSARGWILASDPSVRGTAACDRVNRQIRVKPAALTRPSTRARRYVLVHELYHAVHAEAFGYDCGDLRRRGLDWRSQLEVVADAACLDGTARMAAWVRASIVWHNLHGYRYRWADLKSPEAQAVVARLHAVVVNR